MAAFNAFNRAWPTSRLVVAAAPVHVTVLKLFLRRLAYFGDLDFEV